MRNKQPWLKGLLYTFTIAAALVAGAEPVVPTSARPANLKPVTPLAGPMKLTKVVPSLPTLPMSDPLDQAYNRFREVTARAKVERDAYVAARGQCSARSFSVQDQQEAGCQATDTVAQCNDKLESWCTRGPFRAYRRANRALLLASENLKTAMTAYMAQVQQLPQED